MLLQTLCSISYPFVNSNWSYSPETPNLGQNRRFFQPCDLEIWRMTFKNNRAPLLSIIKLYESFHHHMWIQTGVTVRKRLIWVKFDNFYSHVTLQFDGWPSKTIGPLFYAQGVQPWALTKFPDFSLTILWFSLTMRHIIGISLLP